MPELDERIEKGVLLTDQISLEQAVDDYGAVRDGELGDRLRISYTGDGELDAFSYASVGDGDTILYGERQDTYFTIHCLHQQQEVTKAVAAVTGGTVYEGFIGTVFDWRPKTDFSVDETITAAHVATLTVSLRRQARNTVPIAANAPERLDQLYTVPSSDDGPAVEDLYDRISED